MKFVRVLRHTLYQGRAHLEATLRAALVPRTSCGPLHVLSVQLCLHPVQVLCPVRHDLVLSTLRPLRGHCSASSTRTCRRDCPVRMFKNGLSTCCLKYLMPACVLLRTPYGERARSSIHLASVRSTAHSFVHPCTICGPLHTLSLKVMHPPRVARQHAQNASLANQVVELTPAFVSHATACSLV